MRVSKGVGQGLLRHAKKAQRHIGLQRIDVVRAEHHFDVMIRFQVGAVTLERCRQPRVIQDAGMQFVRGIPDGLGELSGPVLQGRNRLVDVRVLNSLEDLSLETAQHDADAGQLLGVKKRKAADRPRPKLGRKRLKSEVSKGEPLGHTRAINHE